MAERDVIETHRPDAPLQGLAVVEPEPTAATAADDVEDGDTVSEDSGAGSFLDRFFPAVEPAR